MTAAQTCASLATNGVDFVDEDNCFAHLACLQEQVTHATCANADKHFHEVRTSDRHKAHASFTSNSACKECFASSGRTHKQNTFRNTCANFFESLWHPEEVDHFFDFHLDALVASDIGKRGGGFVGLVQLCFATTNRHHAAGLSHGATLHPYEKANDQHEGQEDGQQTGEPVWLWCLEVVVDVHFFEQLLIGIAEVDSTCGGELAAIF